MNKTQTKISTANLLSDEDQAILIQIRDNIRENYFAIGDIANKYVVLSNKGSYAVVNQDVYDAVGKYVGKSGRTVRYYAEQAAFYPVEIREQYDILPFSFFVFARSMGGDKSWQTILDYCMEYPGKSLSQVRATFLFEPDHQEEEQEQVEDDTIVELPQKSDTNIGMYLSIMIDLSSRAIKMAQNMPIPDEAKEKLNSAAMEIRDVLFSIKV